MIIERCGNHAHLTEETFNQLFNGRDPEIKKELLNGQSVLYNEIFVSDFLYGITVPVLLPFRDYNQVEIAMSEIVARKNQWPIGYSGDIKNKRRVRLFGIRDGFYEDVICIVAKPHVHLKSPIKYSRDGEITIGRNIIGDVKLFFDPAITTNSIHLDNDWYNALCDKEGMTGSCRAYGIASMTA